MRKPPSGVAAMSAPGTDSDSATRDRRRTSPCVCRPQSKSFRPARPAGRARPTDRRSGTPVRRRGNTSRVLELGGRGGSPVAQASALIVRRDLQDSPLRSSGSPATVSMRPSRPTLRTLHASAIRRPPSRVRAMSLGAAKEARRAGPPSPLSPPGGRRLPRSLPATRLIRPFRATFQTALPPVTRKLPSGSATRSPPYRLTVVNAAPSCGSRPPSRSRSWLSENRRSGSSARAGPTATRLPATARMRHNLTNHVTATSSPEHLHRPSRAPVPESSGRLYAAGARAASHRTTGRGPAAAARAQVLASSAGCCTNRQRGRWIVSKGGFRNRPSHPSREVPTPRGRYTQPPGGHLRDRATAFPRRLYATATPESRCPTPHSPGCRWGRDTEALRASRQPRHCLCMPPGSDDDAGRTRDCCLRVNGSVHVEARETLGMDEFRASTPTIGSRSLLLGKRQRPMPSAAVGR